MAEITLADLIRSSHMEQSGEQQPASPAAADEISRQLAVLTPEERRQADEIKEQIDIRDSQMVMQYGSGARLHRRTDVGADQQCGKPGFQRTGKRLRTVQPVSQSRSKNQTLHRSI